MLKQRHRVLQGQFLSHYATRGGVSRGPLKMLWAPYVARTTARSLILFAASCRKAILRSRRRITFTRDSRMKENW